MAAIRGGEGTLCMGGGSSSLYTYQDLLTLTETEMFNILTAFNHRVTVRPFFHKLMLSKSLFKSFICKI